MVVLLGDSNARVSNYKWMMSLACLERIHVMLARYM